MVVNQHYQTVATLTGADGWILSLHDFQIRGDDAWVTAYKVVPGQDLSAYGGSASGSVLDVAVQEYDLPTGNLLSSWDALNPGGTPNIPLSQSQQQPPVGSVPLDAYHINSIQLIGSNEFLVSMRNTWAAYLVDTHTEPNRLDCSAATRRSPASRCRPMLDSLAARRLDVGQSADGVR